MNADLMNRVELTEAFRGATYVIHCAAAVYQERYASAEQVEVNVNGTINVIEAVLAAGVSRLVHCSSVVTIAIAKSFKEPATENDKWNLADHSLDDGYAVTKRNAELAVLDACKNRNLDAVVVNPSYMIGAHDPGTSSSSLIIKLLRGEVPGIPGDGCSNFVDVRDVANGIIAALQKGKRGDRYILSGHNLTWGGFYKVVSQVSGAPVPSTKIPYLFAATLGWFGTARGDLHGLNISRVRWAYCESFTTSCAKAQQELGYSVSPLEPAVLEAIKSFKERKML